MSNSNKNKERKKARKQNKETKQNKLTQNCIQEKHLFHSSGWKIVTESAVVSRLLLFLPLLVVSSFVLIEFGAGATAIWRTVEFIFRLRERLLSTNRLFDLIEVLGESSSWLGYNASKEDGQNRLNNHERLRRRSPFAFWKKDFFFLLLTTKQL